MTTRESKITYQSPNASRCLDNLVERFGDRLEKLTAIDKLDLLAILSLWQSADTSRLEANIEPISLGEYLDVSPGLQIATSAELDEALRFLWLANCSDGDAMTLMVVLSNQLREGVYQQ